MEMSGLYVLDALDPGDSLAVREHLATCHQAHEEFTTLRTMATALSRLVQPLDASPELKDRVMAAVAAEAASTSQRAAVGGGRVRPGAGMPRMSR